MKLKTVLIAGAATSALVITGCGSATNLSTGASLTRVNFAHSLAMSAGQAKSVHMEGVITAAGQKVQMTADESMNGASLDDLVMNLSMTLGSQGTLQARFLHGTIYMNIGALGLPGASTTKPWVKLDLTDTSNPIGQMFSKLSSSFGSKTFEQSFASITTFKKVGSATVRGIATTHYMVSVDTAKATSMLGLPSTGTSTTLPKTLVYNVYLDSQARPVEMAFSATGFSMQMYFSKWGEPLHVVAPAAAQVEDFSQLGLGGN